MAGKKKIELFVEVHNEKEFENMIKNNSDRLICAEVYSYAFGFCTALDRLFTIIKLDWSDGKIILLKIWLKWLIRKRLQSDLVRRFKAVPEPRLSISRSIGLQVPADEIDALQRFRDQSEPVYLFISNGKVTKCFRGVDMVRFGEVAKKEIKYHQQEREGQQLDRHLYELDEPTPDELQWMKSRVRERHQEAESTASRRIARQAVRKRHRAELMIPHLTDLNYVLYWPHCLHAHPELYERWDSNNIVMVGREMIDVTDEIAADIFYQGDAHLNEASLHKLKSGPALALCLRLLDPVDFAPLTRKILYEDVRVAPHDESTPTESLPSITAFNYYKTYSLPKEEVLKRRYEEFERLKIEHKEKRHRRLQEMQRLAREAIEEAVAAKRKEREQHKLDLLKSGNLDALEKFKEEPEDDEVDIVVPEELDDDEVSLVFEEDPDEYFPPPGLLIPPFYAPPNDIAKVNGLAMLFPKLVRERVIPQAEYLPPHVLVMLEISKRQRAIEAIAPYKHAVLHMGIFKASCPYDSVHIAFTVKQFDTLDSNSWNLDDLKIAFMISIENDVPLLQLIEWHPFHVSRDASIGEDECAAMFPVDYGDDYDEFEDFV